MERKIVGVAESVSDDFATGQIGLQSEDDSGQRLLDGRRGFGRILVGDARVVSRVEIPPAIGASLDRVNVVFAAGFEFEEPIGWPVGSPVAIGVSITQQRAVAGAKQIPAKEEHALRAGFRSVSKRSGRVSGSVTIAVDEGFYVAGTGNYHISGGVDRHREDVVRQLVVCKQVCFEAGRDRYLRGRIRISRRNAQVQRGKNRQRHE